MKRIFVLVISLYVLGPIRVNGLPCLLCDSITPDTSPMTNDECRQADSLLWGLPAAEKCRSARQDARQKGVTLGNTIDENKIATVGKFTISGGDQGRPCRVIALVAHDNPMVIITSGLNVWVERNNAQP